MSDSEDEELLQYKIILLGDGTVGKVHVNFAPLDLQHTWRE